MTVRFFDLFMNSKEDRARARELRAMSREARGECRRAGRRVRLLDRGIQRKEARIPFYLEMINSLSLDEGHAARAAKERFERELEDLLTSLEDDRREIRRLKESTSPETNELKLKLLKSLERPSGSRLQVAILAGFFCLVCLAVGLTLKSRVPRPTRVAQVAEAPVLSPATVSLPPSPAPCAPAPQPEPAPEPKPPAPEPKPPVPEPRPPTPEPKPPAPEPKPPASEPQAPVPTEVSSPMNLADLESKDPGTRWRALDLLASSDPAAGVEASLRLAHDQDPRIRGRAAAALGASDRSDVLGALEGLSKDPEPYVRLMAENALRGVHARKERGS